MKIFLRFSMIRTLFIGLALTLGLVASHGVAVAQTLERDIIYGKGGDEELRLDVCRPKGDGPFPAVVCIHGGAWIAGKRTDMHPVIRHLAQKGFVAVSITYRLAPTHRWPAQIEDSKCAVRFVRSQAKAWNLDPDQISVLGASAGGHLALMVGLTGDVAEFEGKGGHAGVSSRVKSVVNYFGPTDFASWKLPAVGEMMLRLGARKDSDQILRDFLGVSDRSATVMKSVSPITYVAKNSPPILTFNGTSDPLVPDQQARVLHAALEKAGAMNRLEILENAAHGWGEPHLSRTNRITIEFLSQK